MILTALAPSSWMQLGPAKIDTNAHIVSISGRNGTGKSSVASLYTWLLYDKNVRGKDSGQWIKTTKDGDYVHRIDHGGEAVLMVDGHSKTLKKVYHEVWSAPRGSLIESCSAHETIHWIDGGKFDTKREYEAELARLCPEEVMRMLTDPTYFMTAMKANDKRAILLKITGDISDSEVIAANKKLKDLTKIMDGRTMEDFRRFVTSAKTGMASDIKQIPVRIDEANRSLTEIPTDGREGLLEARQQKLKTFQEQRAQLSAGGNVATLKTRIVEIDGELGTIANRYRATTDPAREAALAKQRELREKEESHSGICRSLDRRLADQGVELADIQRKIEGKKSEHATANAKAFEGADTCPSCGQAIAADKYEAAVAAFNLAKSQRLEAIIADGKALRARETEVKAKIEELSIESVSASTLFAEIKNELDALVIPAVKTLDPADDPEYVKLQGERAEVQQKIAAATTDASAALVEIDAKIAERQTLIAESQAAIAAIAANAATKARIDELQAQEKHLAKEYERLSKELFLTEEFVRTKVSLLTNRINSKFSVTEWTLFEQQMNGGLSEVCIATYKGQTPSHGQSILCGLDIINVLGDHYGFYPPIVIDNAEAITDWTIETVAQQFRFFASEKDKTLRVELSGTHPTLPSQARDLPEEPKVLVGAGAELF